MKARVRRDDKGSHKKRRVDKVQGSEVGGYQRGDSVLGTVEVDRHIWVRGTKWLNVAETIYKITSGFIA